MGYVKNTWVDQDVERPKTYEVTTNQDGSITLTESFGLVTELGTPVNATNMNHIEDGLALTDATKYDATVTYSTGEWVTGVVNNKKGIYSSKVDNNVGNALSDNTKWEEVQLGGLIDINTDTKLDYWTGTRSQYDALVSGGTVDSSTIYNITDDTDTTLSLLELLYPVGAIYIGTMSTCPLAVLGVGTWALKATDRVLQGSGTNNAGVTVEAGLPNIEGIIKAGNDTGIAGPNVTLDGAFYVDNTVLTNGMQSGTSGNLKNAIKLDASRSSSIYDNSNTVQPPAYIVNIWERIS